MKLRNIELLLKNVKGIPYQIKERNRIIDRITSFGYQVVTSEAADRIFSALYGALDERELLRKLKEDIKAVFGTLTEEERQFLNLMSCKEMTLHEACEKLGKPENVVRAGYRRAVRAMSRGLVDKSYDDFIIAMFVGEGGMLKAA